MTLEVLAFERVTTKRTFLPSVAVPSDTVIVGAAETVVDEVVDEDVVDGLVVGGVVVDGVEVYVVGSGMTVGAKPRVVASVTSAA